MLRSVPRDRRCGAAEERARDRRGLLRCAGGQDDAEDDEGEEHGAGHPARQVTAPTARHAGSRSRRPGRPPARARAGAAGSGADVPSSSAACGSAPVTMAAGRGGRVGGPPARTRYQGQQAAEADQEAAGPQPGDQRLDDHADGHRSRRQVVDGLVARRRTQAADGVEGQVDVAEDTRVDGRRADDREGAAEAGHGRSEHRAVDLDQRLLGRARRRCHGAQPHELEAVPVVGDHLALVQRQLGLVPVRGGGDDPDRQQHDARGARSCRRWPARPAPATTRRGARGPPVPTARAPAPPWRPPWRRGRSRPAWPCRAARRPRRPRPCRRRSTPGWPGAATARRRSSCAS